MGNSELDYYENRKQKEKIILTTVTAYSLGMTIVSFILSWSWYVPVIIVLGLIVAWSSSLIKAKDYKFRINVLTVISLIDFIMYGVRAGSLYDLLTPLAAVTVLLGITAIPEVLYWVNLTSIFLCFYHTFVLYTVPVETPLDKCRACLILISIALVEGITYYLIYNQQRLLRQMQQIIDDLKSAENSKSEFMSNMSHEIRTPINAVCGISEILLMEKLSPKIREDVHDIQMSGRTLQRIISDLLDFTELQLQEFSLIEEPYNITSTINDIITMTDAQIESKQIELIVDCNVRIPVGLVGDEQKIRRVMLNILNNAVKFTEEGCIYVAVDFRRETYGVNLIVSIKDTGIGIKRENLEKIFSNFSQVDTKKNRKEGGIGLGLAISKALVQKMGGFIKIESEWKKGTEVQFVIPQKVLNEEPIIELDNTANKKIISYINTDKYQYALTREGYANIFTHAVEQLHLNYQPGRNLGELKRCLERENYTHIFVGWDEYMEDKPYFDEKAKESFLFLVLSRQEYEHNIDIIEQSQVKCLIKPFYVLSAVSALNGEYENLQMNEEGKHVRFTAPEASVLVVDDSLMNLKVVEGLLRPYQIKVFTAESGAEALKKVELQEYDFIFMDHMMPEMDGVETLHKIRNKPGHYFQKIPIIALTANAVGGAREMFLQEGFQDFISKPIELPVLERILRKYIPDYKKEQETQQLKTLEAVDRNAAKTTEKVQIPGLNMDLGIRYSGGNKEDYLDIVKIYCSSGRKKANDINKYYIEKDWKNYTILVHAVKSTSLGIGAEELSEQAKALETAGKEKNADYIYSHHETMMKGYEDMIDNLERKLLCMETKPQIEKKQYSADRSGGQQNIDTTLQGIQWEQLETLLQELSDALESFDGDNVTPALDKLAKYQYQDICFAEIAAVIKAKTDEFDFLGAKEELDHLIEKLR